MTFELRRRYSRKEISAAVGGAIQTFLPTREGRVVCGCFRAGLGYSPRAPEEVLVGPGPVIERNAVTVARQHGEIPVFIFRGPGAWEYVGSHRCEGYETGIEFLRKAEAENPDFGPVRGILKFRRVGD